MDGVYLFDLASRRAGWLAVRQATVAENVSNANTPGYSAREIEPFQDVLDSFGTKLAKTAPGHMDLEPAGLRTSTVERVDGWDVTHSGNSVAVEDEMIKAGEVQRDFSLNTGIVKAFHRMVMMGLRG
ncbi:flagellar basal body rod protein FlgB [Propylenella binzhouense]|uniref:Flagellar basal body rod protein FlgB n=1 Tax=Propylenella binzhouense TaxID=2555902 RepID=A0A964T2Y6_9HYPH|nr:flagellar basal body rod protein FlgB [Propylenella binzhouense]